MAKEVKTAAETADVTVSDQKAMKKGTIIQAVKAIAVLVCICLVCGALLALCNDIFYISDDERFNRSMAKIYPELDINKTEKVQIVNEFKSNTSYGEIKSIVTDKTVYIIEALGTGGYQDGTVTLYVIVDIATATVKSWTVKENDKQSYIDRVPSKAGTTWYVGKDVSNVLELEMTGATVKLTSNAICNAINMAAFYCRSALGVGKDLAKEAEDNIKALLGDGYADYEFSAVTITPFATYAKVDTNELQFMFTATKADADSLLCYVYNNGTADSIVVVKQSSNLAERTVVKTSEGAEQLGEAVAKFNMTSKVLGLKADDSKANTAFLYETTDNEGETTYKIVSIKRSGDMPKSYVLTVVVEANDAASGKIKSITIDEDGTEIYPTENTNKLVIGKHLIGTTSETVVSAATANYHKDPQTAATQSANMITIAAVMALQEYDAKLASSN